MFSFLPWQTRIWRFFHILVKNILIRNPLRVFLAYSLNSQKHPVFIQSIKKILACYSTVSRYKWSERLKPIKLILRMFYELMGIKMHGSVINICIILIISKRQIWIHRNFTLKASSILYSICRKLVAVCWISYNNPSSLRPFWVRKNFCDKWIILYWIRTRIFKGDTPAPWTPPPPAPSHRSNRYRQVHGG
jgi:hypothetical protein